ncbi:hypothetical protein [Streptomyces aidingensis]|uniref:Uncharacterized protein n=1 Tax=Streptomyces aidingensis TaxID=910347 RepID=A0A1I1ECH5_9ACTN|nr:hypothetical protein [Streptomyces aidingensis]SFB84747.1 hypothetical protein SAMN05421773_101243 [Streptomyces aidingensis]
MSLPPAAPAGPGLDGMRSLPEQGRGGEPARALRDIEALLALNGSDPAGPHPGRRLLVPAGLPSGDRG